MTTENEIREIEEEIRTTKYNKATQKHIGLLKAKLAKLKAENKKSGDKSGVGYAVKKRGDATVVMVGFPSVGKSTLLNRITSAESKVGEYEFTTLDVIPGMLEYNGAKIQVLDVPGVIKGGAGGKGRGKAVFSVIRIADLIMIVLDASKPEQLNIVKRELHKAGIRLDRNPPDIKITKNGSGGLKISSTVKQELSNESIISVLNEFGIYNGEILLREKVDLDDIVDAVARNLVYMPSLVVLNKSDTVKENPRGLAVSGLKGTNLDRLKERIWDKLDLIRVYLKKMGKEPDMEEPLIMKEGSTIEDVGRKIHREFLKGFRYARIWGPTAKFGGQKVGLKTALKDRDIVEFHL